MNVKEREEHGYFIWAIKFLKKTCIIIPIGLLFLTGKVGVIKLHDVSHLRLSLDIKVDSHVMFEVGESHGPSEVDQVGVSDTKRGREEVKVQHLCSWPENPLQLSKNKHVKAVKNVTSYQDSFKMKLQWSTHFVSHSKFLLELCYCFFPRLSLKCAHA